MYCQKCRTPLKLDPSLNNLSSAAFHLLADPASDPQAGQVPATQRHISSSAKQLYERASRHSQNPIYKKIVGSASTQGHGTDPGQGSPTPTPRDQNTMSFVHITDSQVVPPSVAQQASPQRQRSRRSWSSRPSSSKSRRNESSKRDDHLLSTNMETSARLFEVLSSRSDVDHPICAECADLLIEGMEKRLADATKERDAYIDYLKEAQANVPTDEEVRQAQRELDQVRRQEQEAMVELETLESGKKAFERELAALEKESRELDAEEEDFWRQRNAFTQTVTDFQNERDSVNLRFDHDSRLLERLQRSNVYNDTFNISHDGSFGTINGLRLGRMSAVTIEWTEINAAWGQACLLLATVADKLSYQFQGHRLHPIGSTSTIEKTEPTSRSTTSDASTASAKPNTATLSLFYSSDLPLSLGFLHRNFDSAMIAFLECVRQLGKHVERTTQGTASRGGQGLRLPYEIKKDRIHDCSIKLSGFHGDENWTRACKYTLTCCKFLLAHASNVSTAREVGDG